MSQIVEKGGMPMETSSPADRALINYARGGKRHVELRWRIAANVLFPASKRLKALPKHLHNPFLTIDPKGFLGIDIREKDWRLLSRLRQGAGRVCEENFLSLLCDYTLANLERASAVYEADAKISRLVMHDTLEEIMPIFDALGSIDRQSLWAFRLFAASHSDTYRLIIEHFSDNPHSDWVTKNFLYPLVYFYINQPTDDFLSDMLDQIFPEYSANEEERRFVTFLLRDDLASDLSLAYRCYVGLLSHPYDAVEMIISHFELAAAKGEIMRPAVAEILRPVADALPASRLGKLLDLHLRHATPVQAHVELVSSWLNEAAPEVRTTVSSYWSLVRPPAPANSRLTQAMHSLRWERYPSHGDFEIVTAAARRYRFTAAGRSLAALMTGLYMWEREEQAREIKSLLWQYYLVGTISPFLITSPSGNTATALALFGLVKGAADELVAPYLDAVDQSSRLWIKRFHWFQRAALEGMRVSAWSAAVRKEMPISCNNRFLSGVDWRWLDAVLSVQRIRPFRGDVNAIFVLFLRFVEQGWSEDSTLNNALMPFSRQHASLASFVDWLKQEYGTAALAMLRVYLKPATILRLRLEQTFTAALTERVSALERLGEEFDFPPDIMTREQLTAEQRFLVTTVTMISLGAHQFEIPWALLRQDAVSNAEEHHRAYLVFSDSYRSIPILGQALKRGHYSFTNDQSREFEFPNAIWPLAQVICVMVDTFMSHPSFGIEAILAVRIRHDHLRREFADALGDLKRTALTGVPATDRYELLPKFEQPVYDAVQKWIDAYMHTGTKAHQGAVFEFRPTQIEIDALIATVPEESAAETIADVVFSWLRTRLEESLAEAKRLLDDELVPKLRAAVRSFGDALVPTYGNGSQAVERVAHIVETTVTQKAEALHAWFDWKQEASGTSVSYRGISAAVQDRFSGAANLNTLSVYLGSNESFDEELPADCVRQVFDIWSEMVFNAIKYSGREQVRLRVTGFNSGDVRGFLFSSLRRTGDEGEQEFLGEPRASVDGQFHDRRSGHPKVAAISAALIRATARIRVVRRARSFHVFVPFSCVAPSRSELPRSSVA